MAATYRVLLVIFALVARFVHSQVSTPNCAIPTFSEVERILEDSVQSFSDTLGRSDTVRVNLTAFNPTCLSVSRLRDQYRVATVLVLFNFTGLPNYDSCLGESCTGLFNMECLTDTTTWTFSRLLVLRNLRLVTVTEDAFTAPPRLDCGLCNDRADAVNPADHDFDTNCIVCDDACQGVGLGYCFGLRSSDCCSFYEGGTECISQCPTGEQADVDFNCIQGCNLECEFGKPNSTCSECVCDAGYTGVNCSINIDDCEGVSCGNGTCMDLVNDFKCNCSADFIGPACDIRIDDCVGIECNNGTCVDGINSFSCECDSGFTGPTCNASVDDCVNNMCMNQAECIDGFQSFTCVCKANFTGEFCEQCDLPNCEICSGTPNVCSKCEHGFLKSNSGECFEACSLFICENGGTCIPASPSSGSSIPSCMCADGFNGTFCGTNIDDCASTPCVNGGSCMDGIDSFTCTCPPEYTGATCDTINNPCEGNPCANGGTCNVISLDQYNCTCLDNFEGERCENCTIENCKLCSRVSPGECVRCADDYDINEDGTCFTNACTLRTSVDDSQCGYYLSIAPFYEEITSLCSEGYNVELPELSTNSTPLDIYNANIDVYLDLRQSWLANIGEVGVDISPFDLPTPDELDGKNNLEIWRLRLQLWYNSTKSYIDYLNQLIVDNQVEASLFESELPEIDFENGNPDEIYDLVGTLWFSIVNYYSEVIPKVDFLCSPPGVVSA